MEQPNQEKKERSKRKRTNTWRILEADTIKHVEMKEKNLKNGISKERESYSK